MIETDNLTKVYSNGTHALTDVTLEIREKFITVIGRNGAGKTTFSRILSTQLEPTRGHASINGNDVMKDARKIRESIVSIPQEASPIGVLTPLEQVKLYLVGRGMSLVESNTLAVRTLDEIGLREFKNTPADTLSGGMKRKIFVSMALASNADVVFLDEPTTGLDPISRFEVWSGLRELTGDVILTTHYMEEAQELSKRVILFEQGRVIEDGTVSSLLKQFEGKVRVESSSIEAFDVKVGNMRIKYVNKSEAEDYVIKGANIKSITLDDVFLIHGVSFES